MLPWKMEREKNLNNSDVRQGWEKESRMPERKGHLKEKNASLPSSWELLEWLAKATLGYTSEK